MRLAHSLVTHQPKRNCDVIDSTTEMFWAASFDDEEAIPGERMNSRFNIHYEDEREGEGCSGKNWGNKARVHVNGLRIGFSHTKAVRFWTTSHWHYFFCNSDCRLRYLSKTYLHKLFLFQKFQWGHCQKYKKLPRFFTVFYNFDKVPVGILKEKKVVCVDTFLRGICNQNYKKQGQELTNRCVQELSRLSQSCPELLRVTQSYSELR